MADNCIFCKIAGGAIPADVLFQNDEVMVFRDIHPEAPIHYLVIPKKHIASVNDIDAGNGATVSSVFQAIAQAARTLNLADSGYRVIVNTNRDAGQEVFHLHFHILGGKRLGPMVAA